MRYPDYMTQEDIEAFEMDMARFYEDPSVEFDQINRELRELALEQMASKQNCWVFTTARVPECGVGATLDRPWVWAYTY